MNSERPLDTWGPFDPETIHSPAEWLARVRTLRALAHVLLGPHGRDLCAVLRLAEVEPWALHEASDLLSRLAALDRRRLLSAYGAVACPAWSRNDEGEP